MKQLPIKNCLPALWRSKEKQLLCYDDIKENYFLTNLKGNNIEVLPLKKGMIPILYIPKYDKLLLNITTLRLSKKCIDACDSTDLYQDGTNPCMFCGSEINNLGVYDFETRKAKLIKKGCGFALGDGIYLE